jgi:glycosyltransferase involved in cell wall biosynthesis
LVSVVVPTRDRIHFLNQAVKSIVNQTYKNIEIIVANDGGEDVSEQISQQDFNGNINFINLEKSRGPSAARNCGIKRAKGKYIAYLDDDDIFYPDHIKTLVDFLEVGENRAAYTDAYCSHQEKVNGHYVTRKKDIPYSIDFDPDLILVKNYIPTLCIMHEKSCVDESGYFDESLYTHEDWDLWIRMSRRYEFFHLKKVTCEYTRRRDSTSLTGQKKEDFLKTLEMVHLRYRLYLQDKPLLINAQERISGLMKADIDFNFKVTPIELQKKPQEIDSHVSVLISDSSGNDKIETLKAKILSQKKIRSIDVLIPDSVSAHNPAKIEGDFLVHVDRNAMPASDYWLFNMLCPFIEYNQLSALSCKKIVKPESDLFSLWMSSESLKSLELERDYFLCSLNRNGSRNEGDFFERLSRKKMAFFNDTAVCFRKSDIERIESCLFPNKDDEGIAVELLRMGKAVGHLNSTGVHLSDTKWADYILKKHYAKIKKCGESQIFYFSMNNIDSGFLLAGVKGLFNVIHYSLSETEFNSADPASSLKSFISKLEQYINCSNNSVEKERHELEDRGGQRLEALLKDIVTDVEIVPERQYEFKKNCVLPDFMRYFESFAEYILNRKNRIILTQGDFNSCIFNIFAMAAGEITGAFYVESENMENLSEALVSVDRILEENGRY